MFPIGQLIDRATTTELPDEVIAAYDAPFPDDSYKAGARIFPSLVPTSAERSGERPTTRRPGRSSSDSSGPSCSASATAIR